ncbi:hypothetical protein H8957_009686 [Semnopithecus entellus]
MMSSYTADRSMMSMAADSYTDSYTDTYTEAYMVPPLPPEEPPTMPPLPPEEPPMTPPLPPEEPPEGPALPTEQSALTAENTWPAEVPSLPSEESVSQPEPPVSQSEISEPSAVPTDYSMSASDPSVLVSEATVTVPEPPPEPESSITSTPVESAVVAEEHEVVPERPVTCMVSETPTMSAEPTVLASEPPVLSETAESFESMRASGHVASEVSTSLLEPAVTTPVLAESILEPPTMAVPESSAMAVLESSAVTVLESSTVTVLESSTVTVLEPSVVTVPEPPVVAEPDYITIPVPVVSALEPSVPVLEPAVSVLQPSMIVSESSVSVQESTVTVSEPAVTVSEQTQVIPTEVAIESTPMILESSIMSSHVMKGINLPSGDQNLAPEIGMQEIPLHSVEEPHAEVHLKSDSYESEHGVNIDLSINNHLIAKEMEHNTVCAASTSPVGEIGEEKILPTSETKQCTVLDTYPGVSEADAGETLSSTGPLALEPDATGTSKGIEFITTSALSSVNKYDIDVSLTTQDTEHDMVISTSPSGGSEADIEGPLPAKDIHLDLPSNNNLVSKDTEEPLPVKESDQTLAALLSPKESSGGEKEVPPPPKETLSDSGFSANIEDINEADLVRPLLPKDMERLTSLRAGIEGPLLASDVGRDKSVASPVVSSMPERASESSSEEKDDYEIFVKVKDTHEKSKKNKNRDKGEKEKKRDSSLRSRSKRSKSSEHKSRKRTSESRSRARKRSSKSKSHRSQTRSRSRSRRRRRSSRSRSKSRGRRSVSKEKRKRSPKHRSKSRERKRKRSSSRDNRKTVRARSRTPSRRSRSHTPSRRRRSRSVGRRRSFSISPSRRSRTPSRRSRTPSRRSRTPSRRSRTPSRRSRTPSRRSRTPSRRRRSRSVVRRRSFSISPVRLRRSRTPLRRRFSRSPIRRKRSRSSERGRSPKRLTDLDKAQLLEIAKANAAAMCAKAGVPLPPNLKPAPPPTIEEKVAKKSGGATIEELTEKCKQIAQSKEDDDVIVNKPHVSDEEEEEPPFYHHPFKLSEPKPIFFNLNIAAAKPTPPKSQVTLTKEFPVSSGSQHRKKEADSVYGEWVPVEKNGEENKDDDNVFSSNLPSEPVDISTAMSERALAQKRLSENAFDLEAMSMLNRAQERIDAWAQLNSIPGQFTGSTGVQVLTQEQLANTGAQAWIKKDQFLRAAPVTGGMGAVLMRKMGWREGEGLGKNKEGNKEPILVDFKTDRKGLVAVGERAQKRSGNFSAAMKDLSGKHPVSALMEICNKRRWQPPEFLLVHDSGPDHRKHFLFRVLINGSAYQPSFASPNKKHAKATAATVVLQAMGLVPKDLMANATCFRSASRR